MPNPLLVVWQDLFCLILTSKSLSTLSVWTSATQNVVPGPEVSLGKLWEMQIWGPCPRPTDSEFLGILWLNKPSLLKFENYWRKSYLKGTWVDSSGQAAWLCIAIVKFSKVGMLLSSHPKEKSMDTNVDWKHTKSLQVHGSCSEKNRKEHAFWKSDSKEKSLYKHEPTNFTANAMPVLQTLSQALATTVGSRCHCAYFKGEE